MDNKATHICTITIIICIALLLFNIFTTPHPPTNYYPQEKQIDSINVLINQLNKDQVNLTTSLNQHQYKLDSLSNQISNTKTQIINIKKYYGSKINDIKLYTPSQLSSFFANRYK
jgi:peptidoglycan hydrolase CwlO-like protein